MRETFLRTMNFWSTPVAKRILVAQGPPFAPPEELFNGKILKKAVLSQGNRAMQHMFCLYTPNDSFTPPIRASLFYATRCKLCKTGVAVADVMKIGEFW